MKLSCEEYELQLKKARETLAQLEERLSDIQIGLGTKPDDTTLKRNREQVMLDIKITRNEIEHVLVELEKCKKTVN